MKNPQSAVTHYRKDYSTPNHRIDRTLLEFDLDAESTLVKSRLDFSPWHLQQAEGLPIVLDGEDLQLECVTLDGKLLDESLYQQTDTQLIIPNAPKQGTLEIAVRIRPSGNTRLEGLYMSNGNFFTQCEAQGFRRITYFPDRPDVLSRFTVTLRADQAAYPVTLSNGNLIDSQKLPDGKHLTVWEDPFPKPAYLFALVAGQFVCQEESITKSNGQPALLQVWVEPGNLDKTDFAMQSLKHAIEWDRQRFGLDLDLDRFMIVATADFNMGAMENKGLNIFNTKFVFANPQLATDIDFENVESVVGHEYFHNWTGNRVTCRDWFQLSLKEGLTVFRDQEFSADMLAKGLDAQQAASARAVKRIDDVKVLRAAQFPEDAGPMAHPIRPDSYQEINNFYTVTVYEKGAEVIRMQHTLLGEEQFQRGMRIYFDRHDGQAATCEDFVAAMETALQEIKPDQDLKQFRHWYSQAGTPNVSASWHYKADESELVLTLKQSCAPTPGQAEKPAFHIPVRIGLVSNTGLDLPLQLKSPKNALSGDILNFTETEQVFVFQGVAKGTVPSLFRGFSAPVQVRAEYSLEELVFLARHDNDPFNRWDAGQQVFTQAIFEIYQSSGDTSGKLVQAANLMMADLLEDPSLSDGFRALAIALPSENTLFELFDGLVDPVVMHFARQTLREYLAACNQGPLLKLYQARATHTERYEYNAVAAGKRALKNASLAYLTVDEPGQSLARSQFLSADNMTDRLSALNLLAHNAEDAQSELDQFFNMFQKEALALDKWFMTQATTPASHPVGNPLERIQALLKHPNFNLKNPNRARSVLAAFAMQNPSVFHQHTGVGYQLWASLVIELNAINPQVAGRMARALDRWSKLTPGLQTQARAALEKINAHDGLSPDVHEIISKALGALPAH
ncbi:MAG TPA: aminopeptidase N [Limnobacter sp.]|uniref:aminopeptidase N n=1 Tax=Limnobacter sp. TaxID=2003368 RepID=UPI002E35F63C|nr:aminopeptidase N [Limnobacter sp.]HEX5487206.1 aminopeptidase N [Limnobacter sp.]